MDRDQSRETTSNPEITDRPGSEQRLITGGFELAASYAVHLADLVDSLGSTRTSLLAGLLDATRLVVPGSTISRATLDRLVERAIALTNEPALAVAFGLRMRLTWHGMLGFAGMSAATPKEAIDFAQEFGASAVPGIKLRLSPELSNDRVRLEFVLPGPESAGRTFVLIAAVVGYATMAKTILGRDFDGCAEVAAPRPRGIERFEAQLPCAIRFGSDRTSITFDQNFLEAPLPTADAVALVTVRRQCERFARDMRRETRVARQSRDLAGTDNGFRSATDVARLLGVSPRTLHRRLRAEGTSYGRILDDIRHTSALELLSDHRLSIGAVASHLGYSDIANFNRAFRRWRGQTPGGYRRSSAENREAAAGGATLEQASQE